MIDCTYKKSKFHSQDKFSRSSVLKKTTTTTSISSKSQPVAMAVVGRNKSNNNVQSTPFTKATLITKEFLEFIAPLRIPLQLVDKRVEA